MACLEAVHSSYCCGWQPLQVSGGVNSSVLFWYCSWDGAQGYTWGPTVSMPRLNRCTE